MFHSRGLKKLVFDLAKNPIIDEIIIISGYLGPSPITELKKCCGRKPITIVYGMYGESGISKVLHNKLVSLNSDTMKILYSNRPVHAKVYIGLSQSKIAFAEIGSANFSNNGLCNDFREVLIDADSENFDAIEQYYTEVKEKCILCSTIHDRNILKMPINNGDNLDDECTLSFLVDGNVPPASGLNWGHGKGHVNPADAYIKIPKEEVDLHPRLFPPKKYLGKKKERNAIELIWDDGFVMSGLMEGNGNKRKGLVFPKQLSSAGSKKIMGSYLRSRIGVASNALVKTEDLLNYGRTDVKISLVSEGVYYLDFSV